MAGGERRDRGVLTAHHLNTPNTPATDNPQVAWRYWYLRAKPFRLQSTSQRHVVWQPRQPLRAVCLADSHPAPDRRCSCGVYGTPDLEGLRGHSLCLRPGPLVVGEVGLWGAIVADQDGYRAAFGYPRRLWLVAETLAGAAQQDALGGLAEYGVPISQMSLAEAVGEVSATIMGFLAMSGPEPGAGSG